MRSQLVIDAIIDKIVRLLIIEAIKVLKLEELVNF